MANLQKRDDWFVDYHEIPQLGIKGKRSLNDRIKFYDPNDFVGSTVIDLGCNMGQMSFQAKAWGASKVTGVEFDWTAVKKANQIKEQLNLDINFIVDDLDSNFLWTSLPNFDVVMFLAVIDTKELENRYGILSKACRKTNKVMYFEGHGKQSPSKYIKNIVDYTDFTEIKYLGQTPVTRPFFRCTRNKLTTDEAVQIIANSKYNKIAVVGKSKAGKTTIRKRFAPLNNNKYAIIDDLVVWNEQPARKINKAEIQNFDKFVLFDYRSLEYYADVDVVIFVHPNEKLIGQSRNPAKPLVSPSIKHFHNVKEIYTVESY